MDNIERKMKKWIELIKTEKLEELPEDIQTNVSANLNEKENKHIFKLLLYLSHTAGKCDKKKYTTGKEIYKLTCLLCSTLTEVPDDNKFVSSLFHIIRCLIAMYMYNEASKICLYLNRDVLSYSHADVCHILIKIAYLWSNAVNDIFLILQKDLLNFKQYNEIKNVMKYELEMIKIAYKNYTKQFLMKISSYLDRIASINKETNTCFIDFYTFIIKCLDRTKVFLCDSEKSVVFRYILHIISRIICGNINEKQLESITKIFYTMCNHFKKILIEDEECYLCFQQFKSLCVTLIKPVECLTQDSVKNIQDLIDAHIRIINSYGYTECMKWTIFSIVQVLEPLFINWETVIKTERNLFLNKDVLLTIMNLIRHISTCFTRQISDKCKSCKNPECMIRGDIYNAVIIKIRCINLISKLSTSNLSRDICALAHNFLEENIAHIYEMKECKCKCWTHLWTTCGALIYNLGITFECFYEESVSLFSLLCTSVIQFEDIQSESKYINLQNPICIALHKLSTLHYNRGMFREAMTACALNALLSLNDINSKAFRMWANIKRKSVTSKEMMEMTILSCLRTDKMKIQELGVYIELSQYNLMEICLREAKGLQEAKINLSCAIHKVIDEMLVLNVTPVQHARVVQMLIHHLLNFNYNEDILDCLQKARSALKHVQMNNTVLCLQANLEFFIFVTQLHDITKNTRIEMESTKFALYAPRAAEVGENESRNVIPAYTMINIKEDSRLMTYLQKPLKKWNKCLKQNCEEIAKGFEPLITLHTLIIAGEYSHLYRYQACEINIWKLAYKLAFELQDNSALIYVIGRTISLRYINHEWINFAKELAIKFKDTNDEDMIHAVATFWISLSDFYFECDMYDEARQLLDESRRLTGISFFSNIAVYLYSLDRILYNCYFYKEDMSHEEYTRYIVETLYTMVNLNEELSARKWKPQDKHLFGLDMLLTATVNLSLRMNNLLSFREIGAHLVRRLKTAQALGATIRVAEILKSLCYIDLSRSQLSDCEVKLQGLEHILNIETFKASANNNIEKCNMENVSVTPTRVIDPIRDLSQNDASPVLRNKAFDLPEFMCHKECNCYSCQNVSYHYLVFISTHIRAQLYALQKQYVASLQHFRGAFVIKENIRKSIKYSSNYTDEYVSSQESFYIIDYLLLLLNFSNFLGNYSNSRQQIVINLILLAELICKIYKLKGHPIYLSTKEHLLNSRYQKIFDETECLVFTLPDSSNIDVSEYIQEPKIEESICTTPINNVRMNKPIALRRNRTPPLLKLTKISMDFSDDEDNTSPPLGNRKARMNNRSTRRKILNEEHFDNINSAKKEMKQFQNKSLLDEIMHIKESNCNNISIRDIIGKISSLAPNISEYLQKMVDFVDEPATSKNIEKLIEIIENLKLNSTSQVRRTRHSKQLISSDYDKISEIVKVFKDLTINKQRNNSDFSNKHDVIPEYKTESVSSAKSNLEKLDQSNLSLKQSNEVDNLKQINSNENKRLRITRSSANNGIVTTETRNAKARKCKEKTS